MSSSSSVTVWTVLWTNGKPYVYNTRPHDHPNQRRDECRIYSADDVLKFRSVVRRQLPRCEFRCLSNIEIPTVATVPLTLGLEGWWPKMELFRPDLPGSGRQLYFDLDTLPLRGLQEIINYPAPFAAIKPGKGVGSDQPRPWRDMEGFWRVPRYQTSVMVWDAGYPARFFEAFTPEHKERFASDQDYLGEVWPNEARMPTEWFKKIGKSSFAPPDPVKVVMTMPFRNDEAARRFPWVAKIWR